MMIHTAQCGAKQSTRVERGFSPAVNYAVALIAFIILLTLTSRDVYSQHISSDVYPTEEELAELFDAGRLNFEEFLLAVERFYWYEDSDNDSVEHSVPNLDLVGLQSVSDLDDLQREQLEGFLNSSGGHPSGAVFSGRLRMYFDQQLSGAENSRQVYQGRISGEDVWEFSGALGSSYGRGTTVRSRSLRLTPFKDKSYSMTLGSYQLKRGAMLALGRRSNHFKVQKNLGIDAWLSPSQGGFNGLTIERSRKFGGSATLNWLVALSEQSDEARSLRTLVLSMEVMFRRLIFGVIHTRSGFEPDIKNGVFNQRQSSIYASFRKKAFSSLAETNFQFNEGRLDVANTVEARYQVGRGSIRAAFWTYPKGYVNLLGSGRSGSLGPGRILPIGFPGSYDRRVAQTGGLVRSLSPLGNGIDLETGIDLSGRKGDRVVADYIFALHKNIEGLGRVKLESSGKSTHISGRLRTNYWRIRGQVSAKRPWGSWRVAAETYPSDRRFDTFAFFGRITTRIRRQKLELWSKFSRRVVTGLLSEGLISYVRFSSPLDKSGTFRIASKLTYRYNSRFERTSVVTTRLELVANW